MRAARISVLVILYNRARSDGQYDRERDKNVLCEIDVEEIEVKSCLD